MAIFQQYRQPDQGTRGTTLATTSGPSQWRHWSGARGAEHPLINQRDIETQLGILWRDRLSRRARAAAQSFTLVAIALGDPDPEQGLRDLYGSTRPLTLAGHTRALEAMLRLYPDFIPWTG